MSNGSPTAYWAVRICYYGGSTLLLVGALLITSRSTGDIGWPWWLVLLPLGLGLLLVAPIAGVMLWALVSTSKRLHLWRRRRDQMRRRREMANRIERNLP